MISMIKSFTDFIKRSFVGLSPSLSFVPITQINLFKVVLKSLNFDYTYLHEEDYSMLYEFDVIHEWDASVPKKGLSLPFFNNPDTCSIKYSPVSHDGEFAAILTHKGIEIRSRRTSYDVVCQVPGSVFAWSTNSNHLGVLESESETVVYNVEGEEVFRKSMPGTVIDKIIIWKSGSVFNLCLLTETRHQLVTVLGKKISFLMSYQINFELAKISHWEWYGVCFRVLTRVGTVWRRHTPFDSQAAPDSRPLVGYYIPV
eukprot:sb/3468537/